MGGVGEERRSLPPTLIECAMRTYLKVRGERVEEIAGEVVREQPLTVYVNGARFLTLLRAIY